MKNFICSILLILIVTSCTNSDKSETSIKNNPSYQDETKSLTWKDKFPSLWSVAYAATPIKPEDVTYEQFVQAVADKIKMDVSLKENIMNNIKNDVPFKESIRDSAVIEAVNILNTNEVVWEDYAITNCTQISGYSNTCMNFTLNKAFKDLRKCEFRIMYYMSNEAWQGPNADILYPQKIELEGSNNSTIYPSAVYITAVIGQVMQQAVTPATDSLTFDRVWISINGITKKVVQFHVVNTFRIFEPHDSQNPVQMEVLANNGFLMGGNQKFEFKLQAKCSN